MSEIKQRGFKYDARANAKITAQDTVFLTVKANTSIRGRVLPPLAPDGVITYKESKHFKIKNEENKNSACTCRDGDFLCRLSRYLLKSKDKAEQQIGDDLKGSHKFHVPFLLAVPSGEKDANGKPIYEYEQKIRLLSLSYTAAEKRLQKVLNEQSDAGDDPATDIDNGQDFVVNRTGSGYDTDYSFTPVGLKSSLDVVFPEWETKFMKEFDIADAIVPNYLTDDEQIEAAMRAYPKELDWAEIEAKLGK